MFLEILARAAKALDARGVNYMVVGDQAVLLYGEPRLTRDIDITLGVGVDSLPVILDMVSQLGLEVLPEDPERFVQETLVLPAMDRGSGIRLDLIFSHSPYERGALERARVVRINNEEVRFAAAEDLVIHKMVAGRPRDIEDVGGPSQEPGDRPHIHFEVAQGVFGCGWMRPG